MMRLFEEGRKDIGYLLLGGGWNIRGESQAGLPLFVSFFIARLGSLSSVYL
jgi:hypothetical protein